MNFFYSYKTFIISLFINIVPRHKTDLTRARWPSSVSVFFFLPLRVNPSPVEVVVVLQVNYKVLQV